MSFYKAINYWVLGGFEGKKSPQLAITDAAEMGLDGIELTVGDCISPDISEKECSEISTFAKKAGIGIRTLATGFYWGCSLGTDDEDERQKAIEFTIKYIRTAAQLGAETILVVPGAVDVAWDASRPVVAYQTVWDKARESLESLLPEAEKANVNIGLENVWNKFLLSPVEMKSFVDCFSSEKLGVYFDVANCLINGYPEHWIEILGKRIKAVHIKNFSREDAGGLLHGFGDDLAKGDLNSAKVKEALAKHIPDVPLTAEMIPFCRLPDLELPDMELAEDTASKLIRIFD